MLRLNEINNKMRLLHENINDTRYFSTYTGAVQHARETVESEGFEVDEDDWFREITMGEGKPGGDMGHLYDEPPVVRHSISLFKNGKPYRKALHIIITYLDGRSRPYELVWYKS